MRRNIKGVIACIVAVGFTTGIWATDGHWELDVRESVTYAKEIFGGSNPDDLDLTLAGDRDIDANNDGQDDGREGTRVELQIVLPNETNVLTGSEAEVTITLDGAVFGQSVQWTDITHGIDLTKVSGSQSGGRAGDDSVTFKIGTNGEISGTTGVETEGILRVYIGSLEGASALGGTGKVTASASVRVTGGPNDNFPTKVEAREAVCTDNTEPADGDCLDTNEDDQNPPDINITASSNVIADSAQGVTFTGAAGAGGGIDIADRTKLAKKAKAIPLGTLSYTASAAKQADGAKDFASNLGATANITVSVSGPVREDDTLFFDQNVNGEMESRERLTVANGVASRVFRLSYAQSGAGVHYTPDGKTTMARSTFTTNFAVEYDATGLVDPEAVSAMAELVYDGVNMEARAYAINPPGTEDELTSVRIRCEAGGSAACTVFLECDADDGKSHFGELNATIDADAMTVLDSAAVAGVLGADTWSGLLSCDVLSDKDVSVQVLTRSDGVLINSTYVD